MAKLYKYLAVLVIFHFLAPSTEFSLRTIWSNLSNVANPLNLFSEHFNISREHVAAFASSLAFNQNGVSPDDIKIILYREYNTFYPYRLNSTNIPLDPNQDIKIIIHGYKSIGTANWAETLSRTYHNVGFTNTLGIDWYDVANKGYFTSATSTKMVGYYIGNWLFYNLLQGNPELLRKVHLIGHSLGAHVAGFVGKRIIEITASKYLIAKISSLEAAAPLFEFPVKLPSSFRIYSGDARIVEGFHTNTGFLGFLSQYAHRDFYISSGGPIQSACVSGFNIIKSIMCSHSLVQEVFRRTIVSKDYVATRTPSRDSYRSGNLQAQAQKIIMGEYSNATDQYGSFFISVDENINPKSPPKKE